MTQYEIKAIDELKYDVKEFMKEVRNDVHEIKESVSKLATKVEVNEEKFYSLKKNLFTKRFLWGVISILASMLISAVTYILTKLNV